MIVNESALASSVWVVQRRVSMISSPAGRAVRRSTMTFPRLEPTPFQLVPPKASSPLPSHTVCRQGPLSPFACAAGSSQPSTRASSERHVRGRWYETVSGPSVISATVPAALPPLRWPCGRRRRDLRRPRLRHRYRAFRRRASAGRRSPLRPGDQDSSVRLARAPARRGRPAQPLAEQNFPRSGRRPLPDPNM